MILQFNLIMENFGSRCGGGGEGNGGMVLYVRNIQGNMSSVST